MSNNKSYKVKVLFDGFSKAVSGGTLANGTCTLVTGPHNIIVDTLTAWDGEKLIKALQDNNMSTKDINWVVCTHGHSDHIGCNYLFPFAKHVVGYCISEKEFYSDHDFASGNELIIDEYVKIVPTPGHTLQDVSVIVCTSDKGVVAITGDLFENERDINDDSIWKAAGSDNEKLQTENREKIMKIADWIVPGHGQMFQVKKSNAEIPLEVIKD